MILGILASHNGTILQAIIDACESERLDANIGLVISNNSRSGATGRADRHSISFRHLSSQTHPSADDLDWAICSELEGHGIDLVFLAGYLKKLGPRTLSRFHGRILNTHPALLPKFGGLGMYGSRVHTAVLEAGESMTGVSIHLVQADYDTGPVVAQCEVPVVPGDDVATLSHRVAERERPFVVETLQAIRNGRIHVPFD